MTDNFQSVVQPISQNDNPTPFYPSNQQVQETTQNSTSNLPNEQANTQQVQSHVNKILIVEDEIPLLKALSAKLSGEGFIVLEAVNGRDGLEKANLSKPDLIITDIVMPDMDGLNMIKTIRESVWGAEVPVILLTNLNNSEDVATALTLNVSDYMVKADTKLKDIVEKAKEKLMV